MDDALPHQDKRTWGSFITREVLEEKADSVQSSIKFIKCLLKTSAIPLYYNVLWIYGASTGDISREREEDFVLLLSCGVTSLSKGPKELWTSKEEAAFGCGLQLLSLLLNKSFLC